MPSMQCYNTRKVWQKGLNDRMAQCSLCNAISNHISKELGVCPKCIRETPENALPIAMHTHRRIRAAFGFPEKPPKDPRGLPCNICVNECRIPENGMGLSGVNYFFLPTTIIIPDSPLASKTSPLSEAGQPEVDLPAGSSPSLFALFYAYRVLSSSAFLWSNAISALHML